MDFQDFRNKLAKHVANMSKGQPALFVVDSDRDKIWETYLNAFPPGTNEIYRERREHDCSCCKSFIRQFGNVVAIVDNEMVSIWDVELDDNKYKVVAAAMSAYIKPLPIIDVFVSRETVFGTYSNHELLEGGGVKEWFHFRAEIDRRFGQLSRSKTVGSIRSDFHATRDVMKRSFEEITGEAIDAVLDLISQKSLYKGEEWKTILGNFQKYHDEYHRLDVATGDVYVWKKSVEAGPVIGKIRNHSIGTLLVDLSNNMDLEEAVRRYEKITAPSNYKRPKAIFTKKMVEQAKKTLEELGLQDSLSRRFATAEDITVNNILFANKDTLKSMKNGDVFDSLSKEAKTNPKKYDRIEEVPVVDFVNDILPRLTNIEILFENHHVQNLVSLIAPEVVGSKSLFKWDNGFSWAYRGNITDSLKENVKAAGGNVDGVLRFSIQWNDGSRRNANDFDAHCKEPNGNHIYYPNKGLRHPSTGMLDVDIMHPISGKPAIENIIWTSTRNMKEGTYKFWVHNFAHRSGRTGFKAEIEFDGQIYRFDYPKELRQDENVMVANVQFKNGSFKITEAMPASISSRTEWGLKTNQFHQVSMCMFSPNYWDGQDGIGHRHYFFMMNGCINDGKPNGFFNEFLRNDFLPHRRVFEALGSKMHVKDSGEQLSGLGFSSTKRNNVVCKVSGQIERMIKVVF